MTEKLYYIDAYIKSFEARVISCLPHGDTYDVVLDKTAFFPEEGGQYSDRGTLGGANVSDVKEYDGIIHHYVSSALAEDTIVVGIIDFDERYEKMQCHTAEHILSGLIHSLFGLDNVGFHLGAEDVTMDISAPLTRADLDKVELLANEVVFQNVAVDCIFPTPDESKSIEYRSKLDVYNNLRLVKIGDTDTCACCAPHVRSTGEIGVIKILDFAKLRGGIRIHITAGRRAVRYYSSIFESVGRISELLSVPKGDIFSATVKLLSDYTALKAEFSAYRIADMTARANALSEDEGNRVITFHDASVAEMIAFSNAASEKTQGILVLLSGEEGNYKYVISSKNVDLKKITSEINKSLLGRGGGKPNMIQGSFLATLEEIKKYFNP